jgi:hypothetical protein
VLGTTGEGILLGPDERRRAAELAVAGSGALRVIVHCGAQTTADTSALAAHAAEAGADAVAVIAPPYFAFDAGELLEHFAAAAAACAPLPFYVHEYAGRSGYAVPVAVVERLRERAPNLAGMKVSDAPFERVEPYLATGLDVFIGAEGVVPQWAGERCGGCSVGRRRGVPGGCVGARPRPHGRARCARGVAVRRALGAPVPSLGEGSAGVPQRTRASGRPRTEPGRLSRRLRIEDDLSSGTETLQRCPDPGSTPKS